MTIKATSQTRTPHMDNSPTTQIMRQSSKNAIQGYLPNPHTTYRQQTNNTDDEAVSTEKPESELADLKQNPESELADPKPSKNANQGYLPNPHTTYRQQTNNTDDEAVSTEK
eukprot:175060_1